MYISNKAKPLRSGERYSETARRNASVSVAKIMRTKNATIRQNESSIGESRY